MRSYLFVPGDRPERFAKAQAAGADAVILDLEDAVAPADKPLAREHIATAALAQGALYVRINACGAPGFDDDLTVLTRPEVSGVVLPKAESADQLAALRARLARPLPVIALVESALGVWNALEIARAEGVARLAFGSIDFQVDAGCGGADEALLYARSRLVLASRIAGLAAPIEGVTASIDDEALLVSETAKARALGFGAKLCIHPKQVAAVNAAFSPSEADIRWARQVVDACQASSAGALSVGGMMIDRPVLLKAQRILELAALQN